MLFEIGDYLVEEIEGGYSILNKKNGKEYKCNPSVPFCTCEDYIYRKARDAGECKHIAMLKQFLKPALEQQYKALHVSTNKETPTTAIATPAELSPALTPERLLGITQKRVSIEAIVRASEDGCGKGVLYERAPGIGFIAKADLVEMIARNFGIVSETIATEYKKIEDKEGNEILLITKTARATHIPTGASVVRSATVPFDFKRMHKEEREDFEGRTFADRTAESAACKRAELALMGIPERSLVELVKMMIESYKKQNR
jgi:hypothetical protein